MKKNAQNHCSSNRGHLFEQQVVTIFLVQTWHIHPRSLDHLEQGSHDNKSERCKSKHSETSTKWNGKTWHVLDKDLENTELLQHATGGDV